MKNITHIRWKTLTYARGTSGIGCIRFKHGGIRWHTLAYGEANRITAHTEYARSTPDARYSYADISKDFCAYENYFINFHTLLIRFSHVSLIRNSVTGP